LADPEAITDGLNPLTISHTAKTISCRPIGTCNKMKTVEKYIIWPDIANKAAASDNATPRKPQPDSHRGMSFD
jgi:hypothetical protein